jgi:hypothetical protein
MTLHAEIPKVDVVPDVLDWINLGVGFAGLLAAVIAVKIATSTQAFMARERRRQFEIEVLRGILIDVEDSKILDDVEFDPARLRKYRRQLSLLREPPTYWMTILSADWYNEVVHPAIRQRQYDLSAQHFGLVQQLAVDPTNSALSAEHAKVRAELSANAQNIRDSLPRKLINELDAAIQERVEARDRWWSQGR